MTRKFVTTALAAIAVLSMALSAAACEFSFSYSVIEAPLGTVGEIGVRVQKEHNNCTLPSMDDYRFDWENIQILGETAWEEINANLYEKWFQVSLSQIGEGYLKISKDCTKEGYEEAVLAIRVLDPPEGGVWQLANEGIYPSTDPDAETPESIVGDGIVVDGTLMIERFAIELPLNSLGLDGDLGRVRVFYTETSEGDAIPLLIVSETSFLRFDHLVVDEP
ncbi:hypothetical protein JW848_07700 [Candidatus Bipolaricaulota bacterium]|nr:hypothetical protein [Candidatus Bipolaricaulota bacterium]